MKKSAILVVVAAALVCATVVGVVFRNRLGDRASLGSDVAVVLLSDADSELVAVDLKTRRVQSRYPLRSLALSIAGDQATRSVVTAQCGGVGPDADDVVGVLSLDRPAIQYVELAAPNPLHIAASGGLAMALHGFEQKEGLVVSTVSIRDRLAVQGLRHVPSLTGFLAASTVGGSYAFSGEVDSVIPTAAVIRVPGSGPPSSVSTITAAVSSATVTDQGIYAVAFRSLEDPWSASYLLRLSKGGKIEREARILAVRAPLTDIECTADTVVVAENDHMDPANSSARVLFFDRETLEPRGATEYAKAPIALATCGERVLVADGAQGKLHVFEPGETTASWSVDLNGKGNIATDVVAFE